MIPVGLGKHLKGHPVRLNYLAKLRVVCIGSALAVCRINRGSTWLSRRLRTRSGFRDSVEDLMTRRKKLSGVAPDNNFVWLSISLRCHDEGSSGLGELSNNWAPGLLRAGCHFLGGHRKMWRCIGTESD